MPNINSQWKELSVVGIFALIGIALTTQAAISNMKEVEQPAQCTIPIEELGCEFYGVVYLNEKDKWPESTVYGRYDQILYKGRKYVSFYPDRTGAACGISPRTMGKEPEPK